MSCLFFCFRSDKNNGYNLVFIAILSFIYKCYSFFLTSSTKFKRIVKQISQKLSRNKNCFSLSLLKLRFNQNHLRNKPLIIEVADELVICQGLSDFSFILISNFQFDGFAFFKCLPKAKPLILYANHL